MGGWLDWMILWVFSNLGDSMILYTVVLLDEMQGSLMTLELKSVDFIISFLMSYRLQGVVLCFSIQNHRITESLWLEKTHRIIQSNHSPFTNGSC